VTVETALRPLDIARRQVLLFASRAPWSRNVLRRTDSRVLVSASASILLAFVLTSWVPGLLFVVGPAVLGVPHVAGDIRYLVIRQDLPRRWVLFVALGSAALFGLRLLEVTAPTALAFAPVEVALGWTWVVAGAFIGTSAARDGARWRSALLTLVLGATGAWAIGHPHLARGLLAYAHNLVGVAIWVVLFRRRKGSALLPLLLVGACVSFLMGGAMLYSRAPGGPWIARLLEEARLVAPGLSERATIALALGYVFLQAVHYSVWLSWIPQEAVGRDATLTFAMSIRSARRDFGAVGLWAIAFIATAVMALSMVSPHRTRGVYLSLVTFHAYLELASLAFLVGRGKLGRPT
jgi:hypothetical protein